MGPLCFNIKLLKEGGGGGLPYNNIRMKLENLEHITLMSFCFSVCLHSQTYQIGPIMRDTDIICFIMAEEIIIES